MKKFTVCVLLLTMCFALVTYFIPRRYKRISFNHDETLGVMQEHQINENTKVLNNVKTEFPKQIPVYRITEKTIPESQYQRMLQQLEINPNSTSQFGQIIEKENNRIYINLAGYTDFERGYFDNQGMTLMDLETKSRDVFSRIPFLEGDYEYLGAFDSLTISDSNGLYTVRKGVSFRRVVDGYTVYGDEKCMMFFDGSGFVGCILKLYEYNLIGSVELIPLNRAYEKILTPDYFSLNNREGNATFGIADTLQVEKIELRFENQYTDGCTILQPVYCFLGTAIDTKGEKTEFMSKVIAIQEEYTVTPM